MVLGSGRSIGALQVSIADTDRKKGPHRRGSIAAFASPLTPEYKVEVSQRIKEEFNNGKEYYAMHGMKLGVPESNSFCPDPQLQMAQRKRLCGLVRGGRLY